MANRIRIFSGDTFMPPESDITIKINFIEGEGSAARVFEIAAELIRAFEDLDRVLVASIDSKISTLLVIEDVEKSSLLIFIRNILRETDDQALKELDWKQQVGKYLVKGKYVILEWLDRKIEEGEAADFGSLSKTISRLAAQTNVRHLPDYPPPNLSRLAQPMDAIQRAKKKFKSGEGLIVTLDRDDYKVNLGETWIPSERLPDSLSEQELTNEADLILVIKIPDFLAKSQWQFRLGKAPLSAPIEDEDWMAEFHRGEHIIKPGDALGLTQNMTATASLSSKSKPL